MERLVRGFFVGCLMALTAVHANAQATRGFYFQPLEAIVSELPNVQSRIRLMTSPGVTPQQAAAIVSSRTATTALSFEGHDMEHIHLVSLMSALKEGFTDDEYSQSNAIMAVVMQKALGSEALYIDVIDWLNTSLDEMNQVLLAGGRAEAREHKFSGKVKVTVEKNYGPEGLLISILMTTSTHPYF